MSKDDITMKNTVKPLKFLHAFNVCYVCDFLTNRENKNMQILKDSSCVHWSTAVQETF